MNDLRKRSKNELGGYGSFLMVAEVRRCYSLRKGHEVGSNIIACLVDIRNTFSNIRHLEYGGYVSISMRTGGRVLGPTRCMRRCLVQLGICGAYYFTKFQRSTMKINI